MAIIPDPDRPGWYIAGPVHPDYVEAIAKPISYEEYVAWCLEDGEAPMSRADFDEPIIGKLGAFKGITFISD